MTTIAPSGFLNRGGTFVLNKATQDNELRLRNLLIRNLEPNIFGPYLNSYDSIDLSKNLIEKLEKFPQTERLTTLILHDNLIENIDSQFAKSCPNLIRLILTGNRISRLEMVSNLIELKSLEMLVLLDNPISQEPEFRLFVINKLPQVRSLDYKKVRPKEIQLSEETFGPRKSL